MSATTATIKLTTSIEQIAARLSFVAAATSLLLLAALHVVSPEFDPSWRMVSEYALGEFGWMVTLMFASLALSCAALFVAIRSSVPAIAGKVGLAFLLAAVVGMTMGALFDWRHSLHSSTRRWSRPEPSADPKGDYGINETPFASSDARTAHLRRHRPKRPLPAECPAGGQSARDYPRDSLAFHLHLEQPGMLCHVPPFRRRAGREGVGALLAPHWLACRDGLPGRQHPCWP